MEGSGGFDVRPSGSLRSLKATWLADPWSKLPAPTGVANAVCIRARFESWVVHCPMQRWALHNAGGQHESDSNGWRWCSRTACSHWHWCQRHGTQAGPGGPAAVRQSQLACGGPRYPRGLVLG